jgi:hypothetical protein
VLYVLLGALALWAMLRASGRVRLPRREWRFVTGAAAIAAFAGAAFAAVREAWGPAVVLVALGSWFALSTRRPPGQAPPPPTSGMSPDEARRILGVGPEATAAEIQAAYLRLMRSVHPDRGGSAGLAAQLNAARDVLLKR